MKSVKYIISALTLCWVSTGEASSTFDQFNVWISKNDPKVKISLDGKRLNIRFDPSATAKKDSSAFQASYTSVCKLVSDFDIQAEFYLLKFPPKNGVRVGLSAGGASVERTSIPDININVDSVYLSHFDFMQSPLIYTETNDVQGKLRLRRSGTSISSFYFNNTSGDWILLQTDNAFTKDPISFTISAWSHDNIFGKSEVKIAFDKIKINQGECI